MRCWDPDDQGDRNARDINDVIALLCRVVAILCGAIILAIAFFIALPALGHEGDAELDAWYRSLTQPGTGMSCCNLMDCKPTPYRMTLDGYMVPIDGGWQKVPPEVVIHNKVNPTSEGVLCHSPTRGILCFVPGPET